MDRQPAGTHYNQFPQIDVVMAAVAKIDIKITFISSLY